MPTTSIVWPKRLAEKESSGWYVRLFRELRDELKDAFITLESMAGILYADVTLTNAQLLALQATPIDALAAPGANLINLPVAMFIDYEYGSAAFAKATGGELALAYAGGSDAIVRNFVGLLDQTANQLQHIVGASDDSVLANTKLVFKNNGAGEWTTGAGNTLKARIYYRQINPAL